MLVKHSENQCGALSLLLSSKLKVLASLKSQLRLGLAFITLQSQNYLLRRLGLLVKNWLCLAAIPSLFFVVATLSLSKGRSSTGFVLRDPMNCVLMAFFALAIRTPSLGYVDHCEVTLS